MVILIFLDQKYPFCVNFVQKLKRVSLRRNLVSRLILICKVLWWCSLFLFYTFFASFVQKSIWHFDVTWSISQQFSRRDLKPVAFLVLQLERSSLYQTTKVFLAFTMVTRKNCLPFLSQVGHSTLIDWLIFESERLWLVLLNIT